MLLLQCNWQQNLREVFNEWNNVPPPNLACFCENVGLLRSTTWAWSVAAHVSNMASSSHDLVVNRQIAGLWSWSIYLRILTVVEIHGFDGEVRGSLERWQNEILVQNTGLSFSSVKLSTTAHAGFSCQMAYCHLSNHVLGSHWLCMVVWISTKFGNGVVRKFCKKTLFD